MNTQALSHIPVPFVAKPLSVSGIDKMHAACQIYIAACFCNKVLLKLSHVLVYTLSITVYLLQYY